MDVARDHQADKHDAKRRPAVPPLRRRVPPGSVVGTFNASALFGRGAATAAERTAKATEQTARNTRKLLDTWDTAGSAFV